MNGEVKLRGNERISLSIFGVDMAMSELKQTMKSPFNVALKTDLCYVLELTNLLKLCAHSVQISSLLRSAITTFRSWVATMMSVSFGVDSRKNGTWMGFLTTSLMVFRCLITSMYGSTAQRCDGSPESVNNPFSSRSPT